MENVNFSDKRAEKTVICSLVNNPDLMLEVDINENYFTSKFYKNLYNTMVDIYNDNLKIDQITIQKYFDDNKVKYELDDLEAVMENNIKTENIEKFVSDIRLQYKKRQAVEEFNNNIQKIENANNESEISSTINSVSVKLDRINENTKSSIKTFGNDDIVQLMVDKYKNAKKDPLSNFGVPYKFPQLTMDTRGAMKNQLILIGGGTGVGKTNITLDIVLDMAGKKDLMTDETSKINYIEFEMGESMMAERLMGKLSGLPLDDILMGSLSENQERFMWNCFKKFASKGNFELSTDYGVKMSTLANYIKKKVIEGYNIFVVDYIGKITDDMDSSQKKNEYEKMTNITSILKGLAKKYNITIFAPFQLNRQSVGAMSEALDNDKTQGSYGMLSNADSVIMIAKKTPAEIEKLREEYGIENEGVKYGNVVFKLTKARMGGEGNTYELYMNPANISYKEIRKISGSDKPQKYYDRVWALLKERGVF